MSTNLLKSTIAIHTLQTRCTLKSNETKCYKHDVKILTSESDALNHCYDIITNLLQDNDCVSASCSIKNIEKTCENSINGYRYCGISSRYDTTISLLRRRINPAWIAIDDEVSELAEILTV